MNLKFSFLVLGLICCLTSCKSKIEGDKFPDMPELEESSSDKFEITALPNVDCIHYTKNGDIHAFGYFRDSSRRKKASVLWRYSKDFRLKDSIVLVDKNYSLYFIDPSSNIFNRANNEQFNVLRYPTYEEELVPFHPAYKGIKLIISKRIQSHSRGTNYDKYQELRKAGKLDEVKKFNRLVAQKLAEYYAKKIDLTEIKNCYHQGRNFLLFMKDGSFCSLPATRMNNGESSLGDYLKNNGKMRIYHHYNADDWSISMTNLEHKNANYVSQKDYSVTESKTTLENWPNLGYTSGFYYFDINVKNGKHQFKLKGRKNRTVLREVSKLNQKVFFLKTRDWVVVRVK